jgi:hypothetical protein
MFANLDADLIAEAGVKRRIGQARRSKWAATFRYPDIDKVAGALVDRRGEIVLINE